MRGDKEEAGVEKTELHVPILEERLVPEKVLADLGELRIHKSVEETVETARLPVMRDDLVVERVPIGRQIEAPLNTRVEGDWLVVPIVEEVLVVERRLVLKEEVRIRKRQVSELKEVKEVVRHERVHLEDATYYGVSGLAAAEPTNGASEVVAAPVEVAAPSGLHPSEEETKEIVPPAQAGSGPGFGA